MTRRLAANAALAGLVLASCWIGWGPRWIGPLTAALSPADGEALFTLAVFAPLLLLGLIGGALTGIAAARLGMAPARSAGLGVAIGLGSLFLATGLAATAGALHLVGGAARPALALGVATVAGQVTAEEVLFRGWLQPLLARALGLPLALVATTLAFAGMHLLGGGAGGGVGLFNLAIGGGLFGLLAARDGGIAGALAAHFAWNAGEQLLLALDPNPGVGGFGALVDLDLVGPAAWGGSAEGLNASWAMALALCTTTVPLLLRWRRGR